jgi:hypothetical protein
MFPAPAVILSCVAIVVSVALSVVDCASEVVVSTSENVIAVTKTNNTRTLDFIIHFIKKLFYKKYHFFIFLKKIVHSSYYNNVTNIQKTSQFPRFPKLWAEFSYIFAELPQIAAAEDNVQDNSTGNNFKRSTNNGSGLSGTRNLSNNTGNSELPQIAASKNQQVYVAWHDDTNSGLH